VTNDQTAPPTPATIRPSVPCSRANDISSEIAADTAAHSAMTPRRLRAVALAAGCRAAARKGLVGAGGEGNVVEDHGEGREVDGDQQQDHPTDLGAAVVDAEERRPAFVVLGLSHRESREARGVPGPHPAIGRQ
jgi:hypothetical protein